LPCAGERPSVTCHKNAQTMEANHYRIGPSFHLQRADRLIARIAERHDGADYFYAALELRFSIEQTLRTYLLLTKANDWSKTLEKLYSSKDLKNRILSEEPECYEKLRFVNLCVTAVGRPEISPIDLSTLDGMYGRIGGYLHAQTREEESVEQLE